MIAAQRRDAAAAFADLRAGDGARRQGRQPAVRARAAQGEAARSLGRALQGADLRRARVLEKERAAVKTPYWFGEQHRPRRYRGRLRAALHRRGASRAVRRALSGAEGACRAVRGAAAVPGNRAAAGAAEGVSGCCCCRVGKAQRAHLYAERMVGTSLRPFATLRLRPHEREPQAQSYFAWACFRDFFRRGEARRESRRRWPACFSLRPHRLRRVRLRQRMRLGKFRQRHRGLEDALHRRPDLQIDLLRHRDGDVADHADVGQRRRIAMAEFAGLLVASQMPLQRGQRLHGPVPPPRRLLRVAQIEFVVEIAPHPRHQQRMALAGDHQRQRADAGAAVDIGGQQRRGGIFLVEIFEDRERLEQRGAVILDQRRQRHLRIDACDIRRRDARWRRDRRTRPRPARFSD